MNIKLNSFKFTCSILKAQNFFKYLFIFAMIIGVADIASAKNCRKGIACGNSCIAAWKTCHIGESTLRNQPKWEDTTSIANNSSSLPVKLKGLYKFRSLNDNGYFLCDTPDAKILKCTTIGYCSNIVNLGKGAKIKFLGDFKVIEFSTSLGSHSCDIAKCSELEE